MFLCRGSITSFILITLPPECFFPISRKLTPCTCQISPSFNHLKYTVANALHHLLLFENERNRMLSIFPGDSVFLGNISHHPHLQESFQCEGFLTPTLTGPKLLCFLTPYVCFFVDVVYFIGLSSFVSRSPDTPLPWNQLPACLPLPEGWKKIV